MIHRTAPVVHLKRGGNPWSDSLDDAALLQILHNAAGAGEDRIQDWVKASDVAPDAVFAQVLLDPTNPRYTQYAIQDRTMAVILYGDPDKAQKCLPNAAAKADATDRHFGRWTNGQLVDEWSFGLGDSDFAWGDSAMFGPAISAGSGLTVAQDKEVAGLVLELAMSAVHQARAAWLDKRRLDRGGQSWFNFDNKPHPDYTFGLHRDTWVTTAV